MRAFLTKSFTFLFFTLALEAREAVKGLDVHEAARRSAILSKIAYDLFIDLKSGEEFSGRVKISFDLKELPATPLTIDFEDGKVSALKVNDQEASAAAAYNNFFISLPTANLKVGPNTVEIAYTHAYSKTGAGLYRFVDPEDKRVYHYTQFEPYAANQMLPLFDQPDLKATYTLRVQAPTSFQVVSATRESKIQKGSGTRTWFFPPTAHISSYVFSLHAGDYKIWQATAEGLPLRLMARQTLARYVDPQEWFSTTRKGLTHFNKYFDYKYPFKKYDQVICPDFNFGAMENVAAVTFSERFVSRGRRTDLEKESLANVILHEMAHMWFGNLVTMKWWDDLWLNESFATVMATKALVETRIYPQAWLSFAAGEKPWAYNTDQYSTTHPIATKVENTEEAFGNFDGITYGKGASVLKQVIFLMGEERFRTGVREYFKTHAFANTQLADFMEALQKAAGRDLDLWTQEWIRSAGLSSVGVRFSCDTKGKISKMEIRQTAPEAHPTIREHKALIALFARNNKGVLQLERTLPVSFRGSLFVRQARGKSCPDLVFPNYDDHAYFKVLLDPDSLKAVMRDLSQITSPMLRAQLWESLWSMVRDGNLAVQDYAELMLKHLPAEKNLVVLDKALHTLSGGRRVNAPSVLQMLGPPESAALRKTLLGQFENLMWTAWQKAPSSSDLQRNWFDNYVKTAESPEALNRLAEVLNHRGQVPAGLTDQDRRWQMLTQLMRFSHPQAEALFKVEAQRDPSQGGILAALRAEAMQPKAAVKERLLKFLAEDKNISVSRAKSISEGLFPYEQFALRRDFANRYFEMLLRFVRENRNPEELEVFSTRLAPVTCQQADLDQLNSFMNKHAKNLPASMVKDLKETQDDEGRCIKAVRLARRPE